MKKLLLLTLVGATALLAQPPGGPRGDRMGFPGFGPGPRARTVMGAPYSGTEVTTSTQVLANGNTIQRQHQANVSRDGQGRTRTETTIKHPDGQSTTEVMVNDPVAGVMRNINPQNRTVHEMPLRGGMAQGRGNARPPRPFEPGVRPNAPDNANVVTENLGTQTINGVSATGTRVTRTIPAGAMGNAQPIQSVREVWTSEELKVPVMVKMTDPRFGTTVRQLTNILRGEPDPTLFQSPSGYTVTTGRPGRGGPMRRGPG